MFRVISCLIDDHDVALVALAAVMCGFVCCATVALLSRSHDSGGRVRLIWMLGAGAVAGCGIWATHFIAMLAYQAAFPLGYDITLTVVSVLVAIALCTVGFAATIFRGNALTGGVIAGAAIGAMHYIGMAGVRAPAREVWDYPYVAASLIAGTALMATGTWSLSRTRSLRGQVLATACFIVAICAMHFTGMAAVRFSYDPTALQVQRVADPQALAIAVAAVASLIISAAMAATILDHKLVQRSNAESERLRVHVAELENVRAELERSLEERAATMTKLAEANKAKSSFLASMSHELRTPLNAILGFSEMMTLQALGPLGNGRYQEYARDIHSSGDHLLSLINDVLDISKLDAGKGELYERTMDAGTLVEDCLRFVSTQFLRKKLHVEKRICPDIPAIMGDERRLKQVLINLLSNAGKFTPEGGLIRIDVKRNLQGLSFAISDTGIGIAKEDIPRVLEAFGQVNSEIAREQQGTGLGLPLAKKFTELHGGTLSVQSEPGRGTTVTVTLPASRLVGQIPVAA